MTLRPLLAYLPWQARDMAVRGLAPLAVLLLVGGIPTFAFLRNQEVVDLANNAQQADFVKLIFENVGALAITLGGFLFMSTSVALDRDKQHVRFFFSHQVNPVLTPHIMCMLRINHVIDQLTFFNTFSHKHQRVLPYHG